MLKKKRIQSDADNVTPPPHFARLATRFLVLEGSCAPPNFRSPRHQTPPARLLACSQFPPPLLQTRRDRRPKRRPNKAVWGLKPKAQAARLDTPAPLRPIASRPRRLPYGALLGPSRPRGPPPLLSAKPMSFSGFPAHRARLLARRDVVAWRG